MSYGLLITNDSGYIQIDDTYANFTQIASGSVSTSANVTASFSYPDCGIVPLILISPGAWGVCYCNFGISGTSASLRTNAATSFTYRVLVPTYSVGQSSDAWGLRVWRPDGNIVYDSGRPNLRVLTVVSGTPSGSGWSQSFGAPSDSGQYAFTLNSTMPVGSGPQVAGGYPVYCCAIQQTGATSFSWNVIVMGNMGFQLSGYNRTLTAMIGTFV